MDLAIWNSLPQVLLTSKFLLRNQLLFWWVFLYLGLVVFFLDFFNSFPLFCILSLLTVICYEKFLFWSFLLGALYSSCICIGMCFFFVCLFCFYHLVEDVVYVNNPEFFPLTYAYNSTIWSFHGVAYFPYVLFFHILCLFLLMSYLLIISWYSIFCLTHSILKTIPWLF